MLGLPDVWKCPECGSKIHWIRKWFGMIWTRWECRRCGRCLCFDETSNLRRGIYLGICVGIAYFLTNLLLDGLTTLTNVGVYLLIYVLLASPVPYLFPSRVIVDIKADPGFCSTCGYDLRGNLGARTCPECGGPVTRPKRVKPRRRPARSHKLPPSGFDQ